MSQRRSPPTHKHCTQHPVAWSDEDKRIDRLLADETADEAEKDATIARLQNEIPRVRVPKEEEYEIPAYTSWYTRGYVEFREVKR